MNEWESWIGRTTRTETHLDAAQANRMAATLDRPTNFVAGDVLPAAWHWLFFHDLVGASQLGVDGHPALGVTMPPVPLPRRMWAGGKLTFVTPMLLGSHVERVSVITSITEKTGRSGTLFFVSLESEIFQKGQLALREQQTIVYREAVSSGKIMPPIAPEEAAFSDTWSVNSTTLFRYSALTFNSHRIHYDLPYAREAEGYENLVVHGPLIATLMLDAAARNGYEVATFKYRAKSPLLLPHDFTVNGNLDGAVGTLWAASHDGRLAMEADVQLR